MIYITLYLFYALCLLFIIGSLTRRLLARLSSLPTTSAAPDLANTLILGIITLTTLVSATSLVTPVTKYIHLGITAFLLFYVFFDRKYLLATIKSFFLTVKTSPCLAILAAICLLSAILYAAGPVSLFDTGLYHAQAVKWIKEYGPVPGLGNLHHRLAFNSSWFYFAAFFDILAFDGKVSHLVNVVVFTLALIICFDGIYHIFKGNLSWSNLLKCFISLPLCLDRILYLEFLPSLSPDFLVVVLLFYVLILTVGYIESKMNLDNIPRENKQQLYTVILCISLFLPTVKLNSLPALLFALFILSKPENRTVRTSLITCTLGILILSPYLVGNVILSGYLIYPLPEVDLFSFDWKIPCETVESVRKGIKYFAINPLPGREAWSVAGLSTLEWMKFWFAHNGRNPINYWMVVALISGVVFLTICFNRKLKICSDTLIILSILCIGIVYWFFSAPLYRFGKGWLWGFIIFNFAGLFYSLLPYVRPRFIHYFSRILVIIISVVLINIFLIRYNNFEFLADQSSVLLWKIRALPEDKLIPVEIHKGFVVNVPAREKAWNAQLPSAPHSNYRLQMRGTTLREGFRIAR